MSNSPHEMKVIAHIRSDFASKFGIPRQSGVVDALTARVVFTEEYRVAEALRGIEEFSHLWLIWQFSEAKRDTWSPTVRPPRLGGNTRMGVFATRSPFRPNAIGLSCVRLIGVEHTSEGDVLVVAGADLMDGTPIYDIKPYIPYADAKPDATGGFTAVAWKDRLDVQCEEDLLRRLAEDKREALLAVLAEDPRPSYQEDPHRVYGFTFAGHEIKFSVTEGILTVQDISE